MILRIRDANGNVQEVLAIRGEDGKDYVLTEEDKKEIASMVEASLADGGEDGVGIESVEQTTTSTEDGGNNVITVTLTNEQKYTFVVKNGSKGSDGDDGADGTDGTSVTVSSVSESTEDGGGNVVTFSDGKTLTVRNGSKGADGSPYVLSDTDKQSISDAVLASLTTEAWTFTLESGTTVTKTVVLK